MTPMQIRGLAALVLIAVTYWLIWFGTPCYRYANNYAKHPYRFPQFIRACRAFRTLGKVLGILMVFAVSVFFVIMILVALINGELIWQR